MSLREYLQPDIHLLRSLIISSITGGVAIGFSVSKRRNPELEPASWPSDLDAPHVEIIIPARDEECNILPLLESLVTQAYPNGRFNITVVDDASTDCTRALLEEFAAHYTTVRVIPARPLPEGWTGKNNAMFAGYVALTGACDYLLFVDADTRHHEHMLSTVVQHALETRADLLSLIIRVDMGSFWERVIVPQVGELYTLLVGTIDMVNNNEGDRGAAANGQFMLIKPGAYAEALADPQVRADVAEDRAIAASLKRHGRAIRLEHGEKLVRARVYTSFKQMWAGYSKTLFWASGHSVPRSLLVAGALTLYTYMPIISLASALLRRNNNAKASALRHAPVQLLPMFLVRALVLRSLGVPTVYALTYPLAVTVGNAMLLYSLYRVLSGKGVTWKGRTYR